MGNQLCIQENPSQQFNHAITIIYQEMQVKVPEISEPIQQHLLQQKPFEAQLSENPVVKRFGGEIYEGTVDHRGRPHGYGKIYHKNGSLFVGQFDSGVANGNGCFLKTDGSYYRGRMYRNKANDENGYFWSTDFQYRGGFRDNQFHGQAKENFFNYEFQGLYINGKKSEGVMKWIEAGEDNQYEGPFNDSGKFEGKGVLTQQNHGTYEGEFTDGRKHGYGTYTFNKNKVKYIGEYYRDVRQGQGELLSRDGKVIYKGQFKNGLPHGKCTKIENGLQVQSFWYQSIDTSLLQSCQ